MRLGRLAIASVVLLAVAGIVLGLLTGFFAQVGSAVLGPRIAGQQCDRSTTPPLPDPSQPADPATPASSASAPSGSSSAEPDLPAPVLPAADDGRPRRPGQDQGADRRGRARHLGSPGSRWSTAAGKVVYTANAKSPFIPASTISC